MAYRDVLFEKHGHVGVITFNRPEQLNRFRHEMMVETRAAIAECVADPRIGAIVLTGAGRAFCAGAEVGGFKDRVDARARGEDPLQDPERTYYIRGPESWVPTLRSLPIPTIAAYNGVAVGIGLTMSVSMDFHIASETARFGFTFSKLGLTPELASSALLPRMVGWTRAIDWCFTGRLVPAAEALSAGFLTEVVAPERLLDRALALGEELAGISSPSVAEIRGLFYANWGESDWLATLQREWQALDRLYATPEHRESITAFLEKRTPRMRPE